ncbi:MAG: PEP-CTERM sorting domain-containing protein [Bacteroidota bacterium]
MALRISTPPEPSTMILLLMGLTKARSMKVFCVVRGFRRVSK